MRRPQLGTIGVTTMDEERTQAEAWWETSIIEIGPA
jgi:hypothetical protein